MKPGPRAPVIVGASQLALRDATGEPQSEPAAMIAEAMRAAATDSGGGAGLISRADSVRCVSTISWHYPNLAHAVAEDLGIDPRETVMTAMFGGDGPQRLVNETARAIADGKCDVALLGGAESVASAAAARRLGREPEWRKQDPATPPPSDVVGTDREAVSPTEATVELHPPVRMYSLLESALRARDDVSRGRRAADNAALWARFADVASTNPSAWITDPPAAEAIATESDANRRITSEYTKLMTANLNVNLAAGLVLASAAAAEEAGIPRDRWIFVRSGAQSTDEWHVSERTELTASPALRAAGAAVLEHAGATVDEIAHVDLYSCFPSAVRIAAAELGIDIEDPARAPSLTGGLTFAGGPGNDYALHSIATMVGRLRDDPGALGLTTAVGWYMTKHAVGVYSTEAGLQPFRCFDLEPSLSASRRCLPNHAGPAVVEAYVVPHGRDGAPERAIVSALTAGGSRVLATAEDGGAFAEVDPLGSTARLDGSGSIELE